MSSEADREFDSVVPFFPFSDERSIPFELSLRVFHYSERWGVKKERKSKWMKGQEGRERGREERWLGRVLLRFGIHLHFVVPFPSSLLSPIPILSPLPSFSLSLRLLPRQHVLYSYSNHSSLLLSLSACFRSHSSVLVLQTTSLGVLCFDRLQCWTALLYFYGFPFPDQEDPIQFGREG